MTIEGGCLDVVLGTNAGYMPCCNFTIAETQGWAAFKRVTVNGCQGTKIELYQRTVARRQLRFVALEELTVHDVGLVKVWVGMVDFGWVGELINVVLQVPAFVFVKHGKNSVLLLVSSQLQE